MPERLLLGLYATWMMALGIVFYVRPEQSLIIWGAIGVSSAAAIVVGAWRNRARHKLPWLLLAAGMLTFVTGDTLYNVFTDYLDVADPSPGLPDVFYLAVYPLIFMGLMSLTRSSMSRPDRAGALDALIITVGLAMLSWIYLIQPYVSKFPDRPLESAISIAYPLGDILVLASVVRMITTVRRSAALVLLALGTLGLLIADVFYGVAELRGVWTVGSSPVDIGWIVLYATWGAAALVPSMAQLTEPRVVQHHDIGWLRLTLIGLSSLAAPAVLLVEAFTNKENPGSAPHAAVIGFFSITLFLLVIGRLGGVVAMHRQALARERALRQAGAALVAVTEPAGVTASVKRAVAQLLPPGTDHRVLLVREPTEAARDEPLAIEGPRPAGWSRDVWPSGPPPGRGAVSVYRRGLDPPIAIHLGYFDVALQCPLTLDDGPGGDPRVVGMLYVAADEAALAHLPRSIEVLASQAALALERLTLTAEIHSRDSEEYFRTLVQNMADVILISNENGVVRYASPSATSIFGTVQLTGAYLDELVNPDDKGRVRRALQLIRMGAERSETDDWQVLHTDGSQLLVEASARNLTTDPTVRGIVFTLRNVTDRRLLERELMHRAFHDSLTSLANRVLFADRVHQAVGRANSTDPAVVGVLFIDLDDFKIVNDTLGHEVGDRLLIAVGRRLQLQLRPHDTVARLGGDEFAVLIGDGADVSQVEYVAERLSAALRQPFQLGGDHVNVSASLGLATTTEAATAEDLLRQADLALYVAKGAGKGQWRRYQADLHLAVLNRLELRAALDQAVVDGDFTLRYQPIVELETGAPAGFEALIRWTHRSRGLIPPGDFIEVAEESGLIVPIGTWVMHNAMAQAAQWHRDWADGTPPYVSVNVSVRQVRNAGFAEQVHRGLAASGLPPGALVLEITESLLLRDDEQVWKDLAALREIGVRVAIDDFGTGYSSLSYLRHVPADVLKIDRSFIDTMSTSEQQRALVDAIVRLAHTLGLQVVAEGVEHPSDRVLLQAMGCRLGQGYLFSKPLSFPDAVAWLRQRGPG
ncbi:bifunctional diguanylate cyclase/phosphodiesterase [Luedemannella helvata]|uniref:EAL domain-containing protein n=1 Tax=Luedemannella helvata TaxID=349315 RepID=A0ABP4X348_9ACTN